MMSNHYAVINSPKHMKMLILRKIFLFYLQDQPILAADYLRKEIFEADRPQTGNKLSQLTNHFAK